MNRSTGIVLGFSALAGLIAVWATIASFDPERDTTAVEVGRPPTPTAELLLQIWQTGDMIEVLRQSGFWSVDDPEAVWPRYYRACALDRLSRDSAHAWQRVLETAESRIERDDAAFERNGRFWLLYHKGLALVRLGRTEEGEPVLADAIAEMEANSNNYGPGANLYMRANIESVLGRPDAAVDLLEQSAANNNGRLRRYPWVRHDPEFADIADHPRFVALMERLEAANQPD